MARLRVLVTGASSGIGAIAAQRLAAAGADVALLARGEAGLREVAGRVEAAGGRAVVAPADVGDRAALERAVAGAVEQLGGLDVAVVAAAAGAFGRFTEMPADDFDRCVEVTFRGAVDTIRAVLGPLERSGGTLVVVGSAVDAIPLPLMAPYVAAKNALDGFVDSLREDLRSQGSSVTVSLVRPGAVDTPFWRHLSHPQGLTPPRIPPPIAYSAETVGRAVAACALRPVRTLTIGGATLAMQAAPRAVMERAFGIAGRLARAAAGQDHAPNALWEPSGDGTTTGGLRGRPSVVATLRRRGAG
jgi:short-subunit dehydrogenase